MGDFTAKVGADRGLLPTCIWHHGIGKMNENGPRLLELCCHYGLTITNTLFETNRVTKGPGDIPGQVIGINLILSSPDAMILTMFSTHAATTVRIATLITRWYAPGLECNKNGFFILCRKVIYVSTSVTLPIPRIINSSLNQSERRCPELKPKVQTRIGTLFVTSYTTQHSQHTAKTTKKTLTGSRQASL